MGKIILILGGARSGKSTQAMKLAKKYNKVAFLATCQALDKEMKDRIRLHQETRPKHWKTIEEPRDVAARLKEINDTFECIIIDCLTLWISNLMLAGYKETDILKEIETILTHHKKINSKIIMVSNEVGLGIVPANKLARAFRDIAGRVNQRVARDAHEVFFMFSGIPTRIKKG